MANTIQQNLVPSEPHLRDLLDLLKKDILLSLNSHHIGSIESFDAETQTASASINYSKTFFQMDQITGVYSPMLVNYPVLAQCPVICLGGGNAALTFPIQKGDECLILFNDRDMDNWFTGGTGSPNATARLHSFSDGIILVGLRSLNNTLMDYDTSRVVLRNGEDGSTMVGVGESLIKIANNSTTLNTLLQNLIDNVKDLVSAVSSITVTTIVIVPAAPFTGPFTSTTPNNAAQITAVTTELMTTASQIEELLE